MKLRFALTLVLGMALVPWAPAFAQSAPPNGSYQQSCHNARVRGNELIAVCNSTNGNEIRSRLDLSQCRGGDIGNSNGQLFCSRRGGNGYGQRGMDRDDRGRGAMMGDRGRGSMMANRLPQGSYMQSCRNARMRRGMLTATCSTTNGAQRTSRLDVRDCNARDIGNVNGRLRCVGNR